ncbi:unnamed protein product [Acanthoscelides obtectus]|uniref:Uncharacterized protein n=1 Tax=Acanthoscelides obtectus TaxID=200917 RepID=A0A9P0PEW1_ACAOB|nr:unnamed protein product [Acanthoscelides obtectus]CAK1628567.1 Sarcalumenin [Acanthoscelides obtectus]
MTVSHIHFKDSKRSGSRQCHFMVRVRNHAKMVDCYVTVYYSHKSVFGNRMQVAQEIVVHPQNYHIYEGPINNPDVYRDFFRLNPLYEFQQLSATCTYFTGCPINRMRVAIAYDLPEMVVNHKKLVENYLTKAENDIPLPARVSLQTC